MTVPFQIPHNPFCIPIIFHTSRRTPNIFQLFSTPFTVRSIYSNYFPRLLPYAQYIPNIFHTFKLYPPTFKLFFPPSKSAIQIFQIYSIPFKLYLPTFKLFSPPFKQPFKYSNYFPFLQTNLPNRNTALPTQLRVKSSTPRLNHNACYIGQYLSAHTTPYRIWHTPYCRRKKKWESNMVHFNNFLLHHDKNRMYYNKIENTFSVPCHNRKAFSKTGKH